MSPAPWDTSCAEGQANLTRSSGSHLRGGSLPKVDTVVRPEQEPKPRTEGRVSLVGHSQYLGSKSGGGLCMQSTCTCVNSLAGLCLAPPTHV